MAEKKSFVLFNDLSIPIQKLSDEDAGKLFKAIFKYQEGEIPTDLPPAVDMAFLFVKQQLDRSTEKYTATCKKNSENAKKRWDKEKSNMSQRNDIKSEISILNSTKSSDRMRSQKNYAKHADSDPDPDPDPDNDNDNDKEEKKGKYFLHDSIIDYYNEVTGQKRRYTKTSRTPIAARLNEGFLEIDCRNVIDRKYHEWKTNPDMAKYITIETFFRPSHFEKYLNQAEPVKDKIVSEIPIYVHDVEELTEEERIENDKWLEETGGIESIIKDLTESKSVRVAK